MPKTLKVRDKTDKYTIKMPNNLFSLPARVILSGQSGSGKTNFLCNIFLNNEFGYNKIFEPEDIYIFSPTAYEDEKLKCIIDNYPKGEIPEENIFNELDDYLILELYEGLIEEYNESINDKETPTHKAIIIDDFGFQGLMSKNRFNSLVKLFSNSRKFLVSIFILNQAYSMATPNIRRNASGLVIFNTSNSELEQIEKENNYLKSKKEFMELFRNNIIERHDAFIINYSNKLKDLYLDKNFESLSKK